MVGLALTKRRAGNLKSASSLSRLVQITRTRRTAGGRSRTETETLTPAQIRVRKDAEEQEEAARRAGLTEQQRREENAQRDIADPYDADDVGWEDYQEDVLRGHTTADISHAGEAVTDEEVEDAEESLLEQLRTHHRTLYGRRRDHRTRTNRTQVLVDAFAVQMEGMADAYLEWSLTTADSGLASLYMHPEDAVVQEMHHVYVVDLFCK
ncbi:hypothetical protein C8R44DRAFT_741400 [Mycena epipterygia]|nr:hypothetical protein C8R44DRAFT_741400 [Mycena epipterygia]